MADLGTYHVRAIFADGRGFIMDWRTENRFTQGSERCSPLGARVIPSLWKNSVDVLSGIEYMFFDGNYACDSNRALFLARAAQEDPENQECGHDLQLVDLSVMRPNSNEWEFLGRDDLKETQTLDEIQAIVDKAIGKE